MPQKTNRILAFNLIVYLLVVFITTATLLTGFFVLDNFKIFKAAAEEEEDKAPPLIYNIKTEETYSTSTVIVWETDELSDSLVNYGLDKNYGVVRDPRADKLEHRIILENLTPDTEYYFRITSSDEFGNQGISSDFSFITEADTDIVLDEIGQAEDIVEQGAGGFSQEQMEQIIEAIQKINQEKQLEEIEEAIQERAEEIITPPTIILDYADIEVGTNYAIISWQTDKEANSIAALAEDGDYDESLDDPYAWREGNPDELVLEHEVVVNGLSPATTYHFQVSSESTLGLTGRSSDKTFKTKSILPEIYNIQLTKIEEESATLRWTTNVPCSAIIDYTNLNTNETKLEGNSSFVTIHSIKLTNLIFDTYYSAVIKVESEEGESAASEPITFITIKDEYAPVVSKVNTESTLYPGTENKIQTIASWESDEPAQCQLFYHQGLVLIDEPDTLPKEEDFSAKHVQVITNFLPSTVYKFWIVCNDEALNESKSDDFTMLTPTQEESIIDIIIKNFESSFGWVKKIRLN